MKTTEDKINEIVGRIQGRSDVVEMIDESKLLAFIRSAINTDEIISYLFFKTALDASTVGLVIYICTSCQLVKLQISNKGMEHFCTVLTDITEVSKRLINGEWGPVSEIDVRVKGREVLGLKYQDGDLKIEDFFDRIKYSVQFLRRPTVA